MYGRDKRVNCKFWKPMLASKWCTSARVALQTQKKNEPRSGGSRSGSTTGRLVVATKVAVHHAVVVPCHAMPCHAMPCQPKTQAPQQIIYLESSASSSCCCCCCASCTSGSLPVRALRLAGDACNGDHCAFEPVPRAQCAKHGGTRALRAATAPSTQAFFFPLVSGVGVGIGEPAPGTSSRIQPSPTERHLPVPPQAHVRRVCAAKSP